MADDPETQRWWSVCGPLQEPLETRKKGEWWAEWKRYFTPTETGFYGCLLSFDCSCLGSVGRDSSSMEETETYRSARGGVLLMGICYIIKTPVNLSLVSIALTRDIPCSKKV